MSQQSATREIECRGAKGNVTIRTDSIPFSEIPGQSKLFVEYQADPLSLRPYYPTAVASHTDVADRIPEVLANYKADRNILCNALEDINRGFGATEESLANIELLRDPETVAVVTGQQAGLFTGPIYTIYKALSAIRMVDCLRGRGIKAAPVFWIATEDHDFEEVSKAEFIDRNGGVFGVRNEPDSRSEDLPVGYIELDDSIEETIDELFRGIATTEFTSELRSLFENSWKPGEGFGDAFGTLITKLLGKYGLIVLTPLEARLKQLAAPIYVNAIENAAEIVKALQTRSRLLESEGYAAQVLVGDDYFPLFWHAADGSRNSLRRNKEGRFTTKDRQQEFTLDELAEIAAAEPDRFSPSVVLRSIVQDHILPTVCYFGGAAEIAYFAQNSEVYRILERPVTTILHRQSFSVIEAKHSRTLERYDLTFGDLSRGFGELLPEIVDGHLNKDTAAVFDDVEKNISAELERLSASVSEVDPTLADNLATRRKKVIYHIGALRKKFRQAQYRKDETISRRIESLFAALMPHAALQERSLNVGYFVNRYGENFVDWVYRSCDLDDRGHRLLYL